MINSPLDFPIGTKFYNHGGGYHSELIEWVGKSMKLRYYDGSIGIDSDYTADLDQWIEAKWSWKLPKSENFKSLYERLSN